MIEPVLVGAALGPVLSVSYILWDRARERKRTKNIVTVDEFPTEKNRRRAENLRDMFDTYQQVNAPCRHYRRQQLSLWWAIIHLNDTHRWDRDKIADWIDRVYKSPDVR